MIPHKLAFGVSLLLSCCCAAKAVVTFSLEGQWTAVNTNKSIKISATVPGGIYTDLKRSGVIGEPYYGFNDVRYGWVGYENWTFSKRFDVIAVVTDVSLSSSDHLLILSFRSSIMRKKVKLNGVVLFDADNMYVRYIADVIDVLHRKSNIITVSCESPVLYALRKHEQQVRSSYPVYPLCPPAVQNGQCHVNYIRKMPCSFSWDWGPSFPSTGIWKPIEIQGYNGVIIRDVLVAPILIDRYSKSPKWSLNVSVFYDSSMSETNNGTAWIGLDGGTLLNEPVTLKPRTARDARLDFSIVIPDQMKIEQWWPSGYGDQKLYNLNVTISVDGQATIKTARFGFRTVEINQEYTGTVIDGTEFYFEINGVPIYAKGSNWIPADIFPERATDEYVRDLLLSTKEANMNMLRVWGGGVYETDYFYDLADELGILIWQDMMFAVSLYPVGADFLQNVANEVRRLHRHPSIVVWAANNENEQAIASAWWPQMFLRMFQYRKDYRTLYIGTMMPVIQKEDKSRPFLSSSPSNGIITSNKTWISSNPNSLYNGDMHYYSYLSNAWEPSTFPISRFVSEHGLQSYPSRDTLLPVMPSSMIKYPFPILMRHRQHQRLGDIYVKHGISDHFKVNGLIMTSWIKNTSKAYDMISYLSQINQAMGMRNAAETLRRWRSFIGPQGQGHNMGFLYWQLNDIWQAPSWASIEYGGRWKMVHYFAKKFFSPIIVVPYIFHSNGNLRVFVVNDNLEPVNGAVLSITQYMWTSFTPVATTTINVTLAAAASTDVYSHKMQYEWKQDVCDPATCFLWFTLSDPHSRSALAPDNFLLLREPKNLALPHASIYVTKVSGPTSSASMPGFKVFDVELQADNIALFVWLNAHNVSGHFSDNGFLQKDPKTTVQFYTRQNATAAELEEALTVNSLKDYSSF
ncbi:hypothetical protein HPB52_006250 [Rhipicephalus sanguineus]|uniref:beta-mannosidase n=1 Tax=Rhipicephalus sanguineus TaxID=34632 RepID=A0A9D4PR35_RHISA|nr:hypothetical protein HPB52_006250 [Rhipicephalus sanguineus]